MEMSDEDEGPAIKKTKRPEVSESITNQYVESKCVVDFIFSYILKSWLSQCVDMLIVLGKIVKKWFKFLGAIRVKVLVLLVIYIFIFWSVKLWALLEMKK